MRFLPKIILVFVLLCICGCGYEWGTETLGMSYLKVGDLSLSKLDSFILEYDKERVDSNSIVDYRHFYSGYVPFSNILLKERSKDSSLSPIFVSISKFDSKVNNLSYEINVSGRWKLWMDIVDCTDMNCLNATSIIIHDEGYDYVYKLDKDDFEFTIPNREYYSEEFGTDCELRVSYFFDLNIKSKDMKLSMSVQHAEERCDVRIYL